MTENKTKIINLKDKEKDNPLSQLKKNKKKKSAVVDTGKVFSVPSKNESNANDLIHLFGEEYKKKYRNPFKRFYRIVNDEELNESTSEALVRFFGIVVSLFVMVFAFAFAGGYYLMYSSYSANYNRAEAAEQKGDYEAALRYYDKALEKTENPEKRIAALNELIRISEIQETDLNVKSYLFELVLTDPDNSDAVLKLKNLYLESGDLDSVFALASEISEYKSSELLYDIIKNQPNFNYKSGTYDEPLAVSISSDENCKIYYTTDGSEASENSTPYTEMIQISEIGETVINAVSINADGIKSKNYTVTYNIISNELKAPNVFPQSGTFDEDTEIVIEVPAGYKAYYTLDGSDPELNSSVYKEGLTIPYGNHVFTVKFINSNGNESEAVSRVYIFEPDYEISLNEANFFLKKELSKIGILNEADSEFYDRAGQIPSFKCTSIIKLNEELYYSILMTDAYSGESKYVVHVDNGAVFKLNEDKSGNYYLSAVE